MAGFTDALSGIGIFLILFGLPAFAVGAIIGMVAAAFANWIWKQSA